MTTPLWNRSTSAHDAQAMKFMAGDDVLLDRHLFLFDVTASQAHVEGLVAIGVLSKDDGQALCDAMHVLAAEFERGEFVLDETYEDGHSAIESWLSVRLGDLGKRVHLGRSRNDQAAVATRLYMRSAIERVRAATLASGRAALAVATAEEFTPMPGYTHLQRAVPSTVGLWMASFAEAFADDVQLLDATLGVLERCPLGTAAGYGVNVPLDRDGVAETLGFAGIQVNPMASQASRGKIEVQVLATLWQVTQTIRRLAWDLTLFASAEFGFVRIPNEMSTGSSIMPNKRNPDVPELLRGSAGVVGAAMAEVQQITSLPSGYHRDLQLTKGPLVRGVGVATASIELIPSLLEGLELNTERMAAAIDDAMFATDAATDLALEGMPFREAYQLLAEQGVEQGTYSSEKSIAARTSPGGCAALRLDVLKARLQE